jgi:hypothetical protein
MTGVALGWIVAATAFAAVASAVAIGKPPRLVDSWKDRHRLAPCSVRMPILCETLAPYGTCR